MITLIGANSITQFDPSHFRPKNPNSPDEVKIRCDAKRFLRNQEEVSYDLWQRLAKYHVVSDRDYSMYSDCLSNNKMYLIQVFHEKIYPYILNLSNPDMPFIPPADIIEFKIAVNTKLA